MDFLEGLNGVQREAVTTGGGPVMIIAGPGSGKTRVLTYRIAWLMHEGADPFSILALTFTNKAAREMKNRIEQLRGTEARNLWMGTFHSVFARMLRAEASRLGYTNNFTIYDTEDSKNLIKTIVKESSLGDKLYKPGYVHYRISIAKNNLIGPDEYESSPELREEDEANGRPKISELYREYTRRCFRAGAMDFDDLLLKTHELFIRFPEVLYKYQHRFKYVLIDEFQDTNFLQYSIVRRIADVYQNITVVGDDAQSIYAFRGANILNILNFERDFPEARVFRLEQNYRSTRIIVEAANTVIAQNKSQLAKKIWTENSEGDRIRIIRAMSDNEEGKMVAENIFEHRMRNHIKNSNVAILYRTNAQSRAFEEGLRKLNIPYRIYGGISFYQRKEVKDLMAYLKLTVNPHDEESFRRIINYPARGIGKTTIEKLTVFAADNEKSLWEIAETIDLLPFAGNAKKQITSFVTMINSFRALHEKKDAYEVASHVARSTGILKELYNDQSVEGLSRYENLQELLNSVKEFVAPEREDAPYFLENLPEEQGPRTLAEYLQQVSLLTDADEQGNDEDAVKLMTVHSAKGLEFDSVFIAGLEENLFPSALSMSSREEIEEERRLFYVAITRAREKLTITHAATRYRYGSLDYCEPSRFLEELPKELIELVGYHAQSADNRQAPAFEQAVPVARIKVQKPQYQHTPTKDFAPVIPDTLHVGQEVEHQKFGFGKIIALDGQNDAKMATIHFEHTGQKKLLLKFAKLSLVKNA